MTAPAPPCNIRKPYEDLLYSPTSGKKAAKVASEAQQKSRFLAPGNWTCHPEPLGLPKTETIEP